MKNMLLTAAAVGAVLAAMIFYVERKNRFNPWLSETLTPEEEKEETNETIMERPAFHAMG